MQLPIRLLRRFARKPQRHISIERGMDKRLNLELSALRHGQPAPTAMANTLDAVRTVTPSILLQRRRKMKKWMLPRVCCAGALTLTLMTGSYWFYIERDPSVPEVSEATATGQNAYQVYTALSHSINISNMGMLPHFDNFGNWEKTAGFPSGEKISPSNSQQIVHVAENILKRNAQHMQTLRAALNSSYIDSDRWKPQSDASHVRSFQKLWSLLLLEADMEAERGNHVRAANAALDALQFTTQIQSNTSLVPKLIALHWENAPRAILWDVLPSLNASELRDVLRRMDALMELRKQATLPRVLVTERVRGHQEMLEFFNASDWRWQVASSNFDIHGVQVSGTVWDFLKTCRYSKRQIYANFDTRMTQEIAWSKGNFYAPRDKAKLETGADPISEFFLPEFRFARFADTVSRNQNQLLMTTASILLYKKERGNFPGSLAALRAQEKFLENNDHIDLFAVHEDTAPELRYILKKDTFILYSIGPDLKDDGGSMIVNPLEREAINAIRMDSRGDIVAGVNQR